MVEISIGPIWIFLQPISSFMKNTSTLFSAAVVALSLASCSKENYAFRSSSPYHSTISAPVNQSANEMGEAPTVAEVPVLTASTAPVATLTPLVSKTARNYATQVQKANVTVAKSAAPKASEVKVAKATIKAMNKAAKKTHATAAPNAEGKSQAVAALLCFFLGGIGVHDFYLGYTGKGILQIFLTLLFGIGIILVIIDFIRILTGNLKPKNGDYTKKM